jgi:hypothetical protein
VVPVDGEAADEERRVVHLLRVVARHLAVHVPEPDGCVARRAGGDRDDEDHFAVAHEEEDLQLLAHLDVQAAASMARDWDARDLEPAPETRVDGARTGQVLQLLEGDDRVGGIDAVVAVYGREREVELVQALLEGVHARTRVADAEIRDVDRLK